MISQGIEWSNDTLQFIDNPEEGISVNAFWDLKEGDLIAKIPKTACLTIKTSGAQDLIESTGLDGYLGLSVALMYEKSLGGDSPWAGYLQVLPDCECLPLVWSLDEVDLLLRGTELHKVNFKVINGLVFGLVLLTLVAPKYRSFCLLVLEKI
jgi:SET domain-containing protein 6